MNQEYVVYFMNGDRPLYWLGGMRFSPYLDSALKFESIENAGQAAESDSEYPRCNDIVIGQLSEHVKEAKRQGIRVFAGEPNGKD